MNHLDKGSDDAQAGETEILKRPVFAVRVQEGVQEQGHVPCNHKS